MVDSLSENIVTVPFGTDLADLAKKSKSPQHSEDGPEVLRILEIPGQSPKKLKSNPVVMVQTVQTPAVQSNATVTKLTTPAGHTRQKQIILDAATKTLLHSEVPVRTQSKATALCTKLLIATDTQSRSARPPQEDLPSSKVTLPAVEVKSELSGLSEENLPAFTSAIEKAASQG